MDWLREFRLSLRLLLKSPGYTAAVIFTLALVIGANSAIFGAVQAVLLNPLPIQQPGRVVVCWGANASRNLPVVELSYQNFQDWTARSPSLAKTAAVGSSTSPVVLEGRGDPVRLASSAVSGSFFDTLGVAPALGRALRLDDDRPNAARVVVLSHGVWVRHFGSDASIIGRPIRLDGLVTVVGVMPEEFDYPRGTDLWLPVAPVLARASNQRHLVSCAGVRSHDVRNGHRAAAVRGGERIVPSGATRGGRGSSGTSATGLKESSVVSIQFSVFFSTN